MLLLLLSGGKQTELQRQLLAVLFSFKTPDQEKAGDSLKDGGEEEDQPTERFPSWRRVGSSLRQRATAGPREVGHSLEGRWLDSEVGPPSRRTALCLSSGTL